MDADKVMRLVQRERQRQHQKWDRPHEWGWGDCSSTGVARPVKLAVLLEETGEVARAVLERDAPSLRRELVQVAAVAMAWLESLE